MFRDEHRCEVWETIRQQDIRAFSTKVTPAVIAEAAVRTGVKLVKSPLCLGNLVWLGIATALHVGQDFASILTMTMQLLENQQRFYASELGKEKRKGQQGKTTRRRRSKHDPRRDDPTVVSEEAFVKARRRMPLCFWMNLIIVLGEQFQSQHQSLLQFRGLRLLAMDGTCVDMGRWKCLKSHFGTAGNTRGQQHAQARMVMLQFHFVRLAYRYALCPLDQGEVTIARRLAQHLCQNDLVLMDACFWSYGLFWDIQNRGAFFAIPLKGKKINWKPVRRLGRQDELMCWAPKDSRHQWKKEELPASMPLRVITYQVPGFSPQQLVTNLLDAKKIPREDWVRLASDCSAKGRFQTGLCHRRWEIETTFRELKVEQRMNGHLRSRTPESIQFEVAGHVVLYLLIRWLMVEAALRNGLDPLRLSFKSALRELLAMHTSLLLAKGRWIGVLLGKLLDRIASHRVRYRPGRSYPRLKQSTNHKRHSKRPRNKNTQPSTGTRHAAKRTNKG
jgi:hypothetical protein